MMRYSPLLKPKVIESERRRIRKLVKKWHDILCPQWHIDSSYYSDISEPDTPEEFHYIATCIPDPMRYRANVRFNLNMTCELSDEEMEENVIHELCHAILAELSRSEDRDESFRIEERTVVLLARSFMKLNKKKK